MTQKKAHRWLQGAGVSCAQAKLERKLQLEEHRMLASQEREYEAAFDAMLAAQQAKVGGCLGHRHAHGLIGSRRLQGTCTC